MACTNCDITLNHLLRPGASELAPKTPMPIWILKSCYRDGDIRLYDCVITDVWLYKSSNMSNHEYIMLQVEYKGRGIGFLRVERTVDRSQRNLSSLTISSTSSSSSAMFARDIITVYPTENRRLMIKDGKHIAHRAIDPPFDFATIVAAGLVVNKEKPFYALLTTQCYWFAGVVIGLICDSEHLREVRDAKFKEGEWQNFVAIMEQAKMDKTSDALRSDYLAMLTKLRDRADSRVQEPRRHAEELQYERERTAEERRWREEERTLREEERREAERQEEEWREEERREEERTRREEVEGLIQEQRTRREETERQVEALKLQYKDLGAVSPSMATYVVICSIIFSRGLAMAPATTNNHRERTLMSSLSTRLSQTNHPSLFLLVALRVSF